LEIRGGKMMKSIRKKVRNVLIVFFGLALVSWTVVGVNAGEVMKIEPKGDKKIKIAIMDLIAGIEVASLFNKYHMASAKARGWDAQVFDLNLDLSKAQPTIENILTAGYDGIIVHWTTPKYFEVGLKTALKKGVPVLNIAGGEFIPGITGDFAMMNSAAGALNAEYLSTKLGPGAKVIVYYNPNLTLHRQRLGGAKGSFDAYKVKIARELFEPGSGDPSQTCYDAVKGALLADRKKEIKGIWTPWEGYGIAAARAAVDAGRKDVIVVTMDDSPNTYNEFRTWPTLHATAAVLGLAGKIDEDMYSVFDKVFAGKPVETQQFFGYPPYLVTRDNLPPKGYFFSFSGYEGRPPDFKVK